MTKKIKALAFLLLLLSPTANAQLVGLNFRGDGQFNLASGTTAGETGGSTIVAQQNWNNAVNSNAVPGTNANLTSSTGSASNIAAAWLSNDSWNAGGTVGGTGNAELSYGFMKAGGNPSINATVTFSGFASGTLFDMVIYTTSDSNVTGTFTLNDTAATFATYTVGAGNIATFTENSTKHTFTNLTAVGSSVTLTVSGVGAGLAGVQFGIVPEPSSALLMGLGALTLLALRPRRRA